LKKDLAISVIAILVVAAVCYGLAAVRPPFQPTPSHPFSTAAVGQRPTGHVVMRVNGEPVTEEEFEAAFRLMPEQTQRQFSNEPGKTAFAEQLIRMKLLEQEARRLNLDSDPKVAGLLAAQRTDLLADAAAEKLVAQPTDEAVKKSYAENKNQFEVLNLSHILVAYAGGAVPPRGGAPAPSQTEAINKALAIYAELAKGADFAVEARKYSDDVASARHGGVVGPVAPGMLPRELEARVFQIPPGQFSSPIPSQFGVHIFKVNSRNTRPLAQVRAQVSQHVRQQNMFDRVEILRKNAKVDFDEKFFPQAKKWPGGKNPS